MAKPKPLDVAHSHPKTGRVIREEAVFLAREIQADVMAGETEIADAIEVALVRYARALYLTPQQRRFRERDGGPALQRLEAGASRATEER